MKRSGEVLQLKYHRWTVTEYAARIGLSPKRVHRLIREGLPVEREWRFTAARLVVSAKRADRWLASLDMDFIRHPQPVVYFLQDAASGNVKIGFTENLDRRIREHRTELAKVQCSAMLLGVLPGDRALEREWLGLAAEYECDLGEGWCWLDPEFEAELMVALEESCRRRSAA